MRRMKPHTINQGIRKAALAVVLALIVMAQFDADAQTISSPIGRRPAISKNESLELRKFAGCNVLQSPLLKTDRRTIQSLQICSNALRDYYGRDYKKARAKIAKLPKALRDFVALTRTSAGEVHPRMPRNEHLAVMKTLANRAALCSQTVSNCDTWDVAVEARQFSMYNDGIHARNPVLFQSAHNAHHRVAITAYIVFQNAAFAPAWNSITHYHLATTVPAWAGKFQRNPASVLKIDGVAVKSTGDHHVFYNGSYKTRIPGMKNAFRFSTPRKPRLVTFLN